MPGQVYNVLYVAVRNGTAQTFDASSGFSVRFPGQKTAIPILTGRREWKPGQDFVFYVLTKKYYPLPNQCPFTASSSTSAAPRSVGIPGPSGIFLRLTYNPATFARTLDSIVAFGRGRGWRGHEIRPARHGDLRVRLREDQRNDFGGYF